MMKIGFKLREKKKISKNIIFLRVNKCQIRFLLLITAEVAVINLRICFGQLRAGLRFPELRFLRLRPQLGLGSAPEAWFSLLVLLPVCWLLKKNYKGLQ